MKKYRCFLYLCILVYLFRCSTLCAQSYSPAFNSVNFTDGYAVSSTIKGSGFSPSITSFKGSDNNKWVVSSFAFQKTATTLWVGFSRSSDNGKTWQTIKVSGTPVLFPGSSGNLDDPQLISIGGDTLVCVVQA